MARFFLDTLLGIFLTSFILVYIKQNVSKKSNIILFNSLVVVVPLISMIYVYIDYLFLSIIDLILITITYVFKTAIIFSLIYFTNNMKNLKRLKKIFLIFLGYIGLMYFLAILFLSLFFGSNILEILKLLLETIFSPDIFLFASPLITFIIYCLMISLAFKILPSKNDKNEDILIDIKNDEEDENIEK